MIIDTHIHVWSYPVLAEARDHIRTTQDLVAFRTRFPELYERTLTEDPIDNSDQLIADMDELHTGWYDVLLIQGRARTRNDLTVRKRRHDE